MHLALPALQTRLTPEQVEWHRQAFAEHPLAGLGATVALAALLGLPVFGVFPVGVRAAEYSGCSATGA